MERPDSRHSWLVAVAGSTTLIFTLGTVISYGIFRDPFSEAFDVSSFALSGAFGLMLFAFFIGSGLVGVFGVRFPTRGIFFVCAVMTGVLSPSLYVTTSIVGLTIVFTVLGLTLGTAFVLVASVVPRWFEEYRGAATGLIFAGNGLGLLVLPPVWQFTLASVGVRRGFLYIISVTTVVLFLTGIVCRRPQWAEQSDATGRELLEWVTRLGKTRQFQLLFIGIACSFAWYLLLAAFAVNLFMYRGMTEGNASIAFGLIGGVSLISRLGVGYLSDLTGVGRAYLLSYICAVVGMGMLFFSLSYTMAVAIFFLGLGLGGLATLYVPLLMNIYSPDKDTAVIGLFNIAPGLGALAMPPLGNALIIYTEGFTLAILLAFVTTVTGVVSTVVGMNAA